VKQNNHLSISLKQNNHLLINLKQRNHLSINLKQNNYLSNQSTIKRTKEYPGTTFTSIKEIFVSRQPFIFQIRKIRTTIRVLIHYITTLFFSLELKKYKSTEIGKGTPIPQLHLIGEFLF